MLATRPVPQAVFVRFSLDSIVFSSLEESVTVVTLQQETFACHDTTGNVSLPCMVEVIFARFFCCKVKFFRKEIIKSSHTQGGQWHG